MKYKKYHAVRTKENKNEKQKNTTLSEQIRIKWKTKNTTLSEQMRIKWNTKNTTLSEQIRIKWKRKKYHTVRTNKN